MRALALTSLPCTYFLNKSVFLTTGVFNKLRGLRGVIWDIACAT